MRVAAVQMSSGPDKGANLGAAAALIDQAVADGARLVVLPEMFNCLGTGAELAAGAEPLEGSTAAWASAQAAAHGIWLVAGTFLEQVGETAGDAAGRARLRNTCTVWDPSGVRRAVYRKIHLFDVTVPGAEYHESGLIEAGDEVVVADLGGLRDGHSDAGSLGLSVCYDLRFPELYRIATLQGATIVTVPAAFTARTGPPHWEVLLRARAIENQVFVIAAGQSGTTGPGLAWHGHSMIIDPWGNLLVATDGGPDDTRGRVVVADLDLAEQERVRGILPSLANRRPATYRWPD